MKRHTSTLAPTRVALAVLMAMSAASASAIEFEVGDGWKGNWNTTLSAAQTWRAQGQDSRLYSRADGLVRGFTNGTGGSNTDANNLNWDRGDTVSQVFKFTTDLSLAKGGTGALVRLKGWYDNSLINRNAPFGNQAQRPYYTPGQPLSDEGLQVESRFQGIKLMDAYGYTSFNLGDNPLQVRVGNQVINWGEGLFLQGMNYTSPIDLPALRRGAGTELKEFLIPVAMAYGNLGLPGGMSLEGFYQLQWQRTVVDACGTYFAPAESAVNFGIGNCNVATTFGGLTNAGAIGAGQFVKLVDGDKAPNSGQWGLAFRFPVDQLDTEFGLYYQNVHSRVPYISAKTGQPLPAGAPLLFLPGASQNAMSAFWEYPKNIQIFGLTAATNIAGWSTGFELSYTKDLPAQLNANDLVAAFLQGVGPLGATARALAGRVPGTPAAPIGTVFSGYNRFDKTQLQLNAVKLFSNVLGAQNLTIVGEIGFQWNNVPDYKDNGLRYGRGFIFGLGATPTLGPADCFPGNPQPQGCYNQGYITRTASGSRLRGTLTYNDVFGTGVAVLPSLFWAHDIQGTSIDGQFNEGRDTVALGLKFDYNKRYTLDLAYVTYSDSAQFDNLRDHDFYSIGLAVTF